MTLLVKSSRFDVSPEALFEFHMDAENLARISPPWPPFVPVSTPQPTQLGDIQVFRVGPWPIARTWQARITQLVPGRLLEDTQEAGPFQRWRHQHRVAPDGDGSRLTDVVAFRLLPTRVGEFIEYFSVRPALWAMFTYRHWRTRRLLANHKA
jgi:ligand-binding SRPBCC domain-containing protein